MFATDPRGVPRGFHNATIRAYLWSPVRCGLETELNIEIEVVAGVDRISVVSLKGDGLVSSSTEDPLNV